MACAFEALYVTKMVYVIVQQGTKDFFGGRGVWDI